MQFEYDPERLIEEVKKRPGIWDYEHPNYRTMATRVALWNEVVRELLQPSVKISKSEMRELVLQLQKKWKSLKDSFQKYIHNPNRTRRPYIYSKQLQFLLKNEAETEGNDDGGGGGGDGSSESEVERKPKKTWRSRKRMRIVKDEDQTSGDEKDAESQDDSVVYPSGDGGGEGTSTKTPKKSKPAEEFAFASVDSKSFEGEDCDKMFLLSLLPHLKTIPEELRINVKMELLQVLRNANYVNGHMTSDIIG